MDQLFLVLILFLPTPITHCTQEHETITLYKIYAKYYSQIVCNGCDTTHKIRSHCKINYYFAFNLQKSKEFVLCKLEIGKTTELTVV